MQKIVWAVCTCILIGAVGLYFTVFQTQQNTMAQGGITTPDAMVISWQNYDAFWQAVDDNTGSDGTVDIAKFKSQYKKSMSANLQQFYTRTYGDIDTAIHQSAEMIPFFTSYRQVIDKNAIDTQAIKDLYGKIFAYLPEGKLPKTIEFVVGAFNNDMGITDNAVIIATDMFYKGHADTMAWNTLPYDSDKVTTLQNGYYPYSADANGFSDVVAYNLIHHLQAQYDSGLHAYEDKRHATKNVKVRYPIVHEGIAEFLQFILTGRESDRVIEGDTYADKGKNGGFSTQFSRFYEDSHMDDVKTISKYINNLTPAKGKPVDYGHWLGYRIAKNYWWRNMDKNKAVQDLINPKNADKIVQSAVFVTTVR